MQTMNVSLTPALIKIVQKKVKSGLYGNASEVIREAIRQMETNAEATYQLKLEKLKKALQLGIDDIKAGRTVPYDKGFMNRSVARARKRVNKGKKSVSNGEQVFA